MEARRLLRRLGGRIPELFVVVLPIAIAGMVGKWPEEIARARFLWPPRAVSIPATAFWTACVVATLMAVVVLARNEMSATKAEEQARAQQLALGLSPAISAMLQACQSACTRYAKDHPKSAARVVLEALAYVAWLYDNKPAGARYAANVMLFVPKDDVNEELRRRIAFWDGEANDLEGALDLQLELSSVLGSTGAKDPGLRPLALPVPRTKTRRKRLRMKQRVLPGAPQAFDRHDSDMKTDSGDLVRWCRKQGAFSETVAEELSKYLVSPEGRLTRSLISIAIKSTGRSEPLGVINIHRDTPGMLGNRPDAFIPLTLGLQELLTQVLAKHLT